MGIRKGSAQKTNNRTEGAVFIFHLKTKAKKVRLVLAN